MPKNNIQETAFVFTNVQGQAGVAGDRMAYRTVAYLKCQLTFTL